MNNKRLSRHRNPAMNSLSIPLGKLQKLIRLVPICRWLTADLFNANSIISHNSLQPQLLRLLHTDTQGKRLFLYIFTLHLIESTEEYALKIHLRLIIQLDFQASPPLPRYLVQQFYKQI